MKRQSSFVDRAILAFDVALRAVCAPEKRQSSRANPADNISESPMSVEELRHVAGLMRINHAGEVCAQALYQGQAISAKLPTIQLQMEQAALEEVDHLAWCESRLHELNSTSGWLNPFWYGSAFTIGLLAGFIGDEWSLGFVAETERQVTEHLKNHLNRLPPQDEKTRAILYQMQLDESLHAEQAQNAGAVELPFWIRQGMRWASLLMTKTSYYF